MTRASTRRSYTRCWINDDTLPATRGAAGGRTIRMLNACACRWERKKPPPFVPSWASAALCAVLCSARPLSWAFSHAHRSVLSTAALPCVYTHQLCVSSTVVCFFSSLSLCVSLFQTNKYWPNILSSVWLFLNAVAYFQSNHNWRKSESSFETGKERCWAKMSATTATTTTATAIVVRSIIARYEAPLSSSSTMVYSRWTDQRGSILLFIATAVVSLFLSSAT